MYRNHVAYIDSFNRCGEKMNKEEYEIENIKARLEFFKILKKILRNDLKALNEMESIEAKELINEIIEVL